jgi:hypothetical protein
VRREKRSFRVEPKLSLITDIVQKRSVFLHEKLVVTQAHSGEWPNAAARMRVHWRLWFDHVIGLSSPVLYLRGSGSNNVHIHTIPMSWSMATSTIPYTSWSRPNSRSGPPFLSTSHPAFPSFCFPRHLNPLESYKCETNQPIHILYIYIFFLYGHWNSGRMSSRRTANTWMGFVFPRVSKDLRGDTTRTPQGTATVFVGTTRCRFGDLVACTCRFTRPTQGIQSPKGK